MKIGIVIPVYIATDLHIDFTEQTIGSIKTKHETQIYTILNYCHPMFQSRADHLPNIVPNPKGNALAAAWNLGMDLAIKDSCDYILFPNNDILFHPECIDNLVDFANENHQAVMWTAAQADGNDRNFKLSPPEPRDDFDEHPHFSCFMVEREFPQILSKIERGTKEPFPGYFDENYKPAYFEDGDMHNRILRANLKALKTARAWFYHYGSRTIHVDENLFRSNGTTYEKNKAYFTQKWGWNPQDNSPVENDDQIRFKFKQPFEKAD